MAAVPEEQRTRAGDPAAHDRIVAAASLMRVEEPVHVAAAALSSGDPIDAFRLARIVRVGKARPTFDGCRTLFSLDDPAQAVEIWGVEVFTGILSWLRYLDAQLAPEQA